LKNTNFLR